MTREHLTFACEDQTLVGTLDSGTQSTGLLLVSGGNEVRSGAWGGQAQLAAAIAAEGFPVFRFDRRGTGDSEGVNGTFRSSGLDIAAALSAFRSACPHLDRIIGLGNCDAASALMLTKGEGLDALVLANPWTIDDEEARPPPQILRAHYRRRLNDPAAIKRLLTGRVSIRRMIASLADALRPAPAPGGLVQAMAAAIANFDGPVVFLVAQNDRTGQAFLSTWGRADNSIRLCPAASHSFVEPHAREWLLQQVLGVLRV